MSSQGASRIDAFIRFVTIEAGAQLKRRRLDAARIAEIVANGKLPRLFLGGSNLDRLG
jgi:hypothetical protein